jgi:signal peptidase I
VLTPTGRRGRHARLPIPDAPIPDAPILDAAAPDRDMQAAGEELPADGEQPAGRRKKSWRQLMQVVVVAIVLMLLIKAFIVQVYRIPSASMEDTLLTGDRVLVNKLVYHVRGIARGDIVVFSGQGSWGTTTGAPDPAPPGNPLVRAMYDVLADVGVYSTQTYYIKRVIGLPGDHVGCCVNGKVTVNGVPLDETSYLFPAASPSMQLFHVIVPPGRIWVMGDNRAISDDSRGHMSADFPAMGTVPENEVAGRAFLIIWPLSQLGDLPIPATFQQAALHAGTSGAPVLQMAGGSGGPFSTMPVGSLAPLRGALGRRKHVSHCCITGSGVFQRGCRVHVVRARREITRVVLGQGARIRCHSFYSARDRGSLWP